MVEMNPEQRFQRLCTLGRLGVGEQVFIMKPGPDKIYLGRGSVVRGLHAAVGGHLSDRYRISVRRDGQGAGACEYCAASPAAGYIFVFDKCQDLPPGHPCQ